MREDVSTGGKEVFEGRMSPRMAMVDGGRKTVVCSWQGKRGIGARFFHVPLEDPW
jgi:hypothetical protein